MTGQLTNLSEFRFDSLRKFMQPIYGELNRHSQDTKEKKQEILGEVISQFFSRLRIYREIPLEVVAEHANLPCEVVRQFEAGEFKITRSLEYAYCKACSGTQEREFFDRRIYEFIHPTVKASREAVAMDALRRFGIVMPDVDYAGLKSPKGVLLSFPG